ncbi:hypothetical protein FHX80_11654 [Streptomyces brevispora]|uniref:Uncharacterized protein n=1 Tax=Streptomyces brevispora TaxID=887462 RepID=A0A561USE3_9ACTN|nr:hypothetical protein FHX80_11654 [Streptomyces brevispora]
MRSGGKSSVPVARVPYARAMVRSVRPRNGVRSAKPEYDSSTSEVSPGRSRSGARPCGIRHWNRQSVRSPAVRSESPAGGADSSTASRSGFRFSANSRSAVSAPAAAKVSLTPVHGGQPLVLRESGVRLRQSAAEHLRQPVRLRRAGERAHRVRDQPRAGLRRDQRPRHRAEHRRREPDQRNFKTLHRSSSPCRTMVEGSCDGRAVRSHQELLTTRLAYLLVTTSGPGPTCGSTVLACRRTCPM